ncbi:hypothetical protein ACFOU2_06535 [Bacillus songklensis]|uniref:Uncharacterized protein n=1 Tax=Bacillus songklensis TaxID=1069116 RepID=A0ABV8B1V7_9BACI
MVPPLFLFQRMISGESLRLQVDDDQRRIFYVSESPAKTAQELITAIPSVITEMHHLFTTEV